MRSSLANDIKRCMTNFREIEIGHASAEFIFPDDFMGFQGHFENKPILPGVCKILAALEVMNEWKKEVGLREVVSAKFFQPVTCNEKILFECFEIRAKSDVQLIKIKITYSGNKVAELKLKVQF